jgi:hypothetical protein
LSIIGGRIVVARPTEVSKDPAGSTEVERARAGRKGGHPNGARFA